jgi:hypothetical protein
MDKISRVLSIRQSLEKKQNNNAKDFLGKNEI